MIQFYDLEIPEKIIIIQYWYPYNNLYMRKLELNLQDCEPYYIGTKRYDQRLEFYVPFFGFFDYRDFKRTKIPYMDYDKFNKLKAFL